MVNSFLPMYRLHLLKTLPNPVRIGQPVSLTISLTDDLGAFVGPSGERRVEIGFALVAQQQPNLFKQGSHRSRDDGGRKNKATTRPLVGIRSCDGYALRVAQPIFLTLGQPNFTQTTVTVVCSSAEGKPKAAEAAAAPSQFHLVVFAKPSIPFPLKSLNSEVSDNWCSLALERSASFLYGTCLNLLEPDTESSACVLAAISAPFAIRSAGKCQEQPAHGPSFHFRYFPRLSAMIKEEFGLTLGTHIWDCALVLAEFLMDNREWSGKPEETAVVELGAGCGFLSVCLAQAGFRHVIATDIGAQTLQLLEENLQPCPNTNCSVVALDWNTSKLPDDFQKPLQHSRELVLVAADVLYNTGSHDAFLQIVQTFRQAFRAPIRLLLAYKKRTEGEHVFFEKAQRLGMRFRVVHQQRHVSVYEFSWHEEEEEERLR